MPTKIWFYINRRVWYIRSPNTSLRYSSKGLKIVQYLDDEFALKHLIRLLKKKFKKKKKIFFYFKKKKKLRWRYIFMSSSISNNFFTATLVRRRGKWASSVRVQACRSAPRNIKSKKHARRSSAAQARATAMRARILQRSHVICFQHCAAHSIFNAENS